ncbi:MAG: hypothetical protein J0M34_00675 [Alphaproteobacteria bacterium]|nr:hypothetical protein [Alphaproteobacteria bacterium]
MRILIVVIACMMSLTTAHADVLSADAVPERKEVPFTRMTNITVGWRIDITPPAGAVTITSAPGEFRIGGVTVATTRTLSRTFVNNPAGGVLPLIMETVAVPRSVITRAQQQDAAFSYMREFTDDNVVFQQGEIDLHITGNAAGAVALSSQSLTFSDGSSYQSVAQGAPLRAVANLFVNGTGILRAVWEISADTGTSQNTLWRPLRNVTRQVAGTPNIQLTSPDLPTDILGRIRIRLRMVDPASDINTTIPFIDYFVVESVERTTPTTFKPKVRAKEGGGIRHNHE